MMIRQPILPPEAPSAIQGALHKVWEPDETLQFAAVSAPKAMKQDGRRGIWIAVGWLIFVYALVAWFDPAFRPPFQAGVSGLQTLVGVLVLLMAVVRIIRIYLLLHENVWYVVSDRRFLVLAQSLVITHVESFSPDLRHEITIENTPQGFRHLHFIRLPKDDDARDPDLETCFFAIENPEAAQSALENLQIPQENATHLVKSYFNVKL